MSDRPISAAECPRSSSALPRRTACLPKPPTCSLGISSLTISILISRSFNDRLLACAYPVQDSLQVVAANDEEQARCNVGDGQDRAEHKCLDQAQRAFRAHKCAHRSDAKQNETRPQVRRRQQL